MRKSFENFCLLVLDTAKRYPMKHRFSVKSSVVFTGTVQLVRLKRGEAMVSFDVKALFSSVLADKAVEFLEKHLHREEASGKEIMICTSVAKTCMN